MPSVGRDSMRVGGRSTEAVLARDKVTAAGLSVAVVTIACIFCPEVRHWLVIPAAASGAVIGWEAVAWARGARRPFDCDVAVSLVGTYVFLLAPLLHVVLDQYMGYVVPPPDWRPWLGRMGVFNFAGIVAYRVARSLRLRARTRSVLPLWRMRTGWRGPLLSLLAASVALQVWIYDRFHGVAGYISTFDEGRQGGEGFSGLGWVFALSESAPMLIVIIVLGGAAPRYLRRSWMRLGAFLVLMFCIKLLFGGMRGSRSEVIWFMFWCLAVIDFRVRPLGRAAILAGATCALLFMYGYGFYKAVGLQGVQALSDTTGRKALEASTKRTFAAMLVGDLGRADIQAYLMYKYYEYPEHYSPAMGKTYLADVLAYVPSALGLPRPPGKLEAGTRLQYGPMAYNPMGFHSTVIYGLAGETLLNFGPMWIPAAYFVFGLIVSMMRRLETTIATNDARRVLLPLLAYAAVLMLTHDVDNVLYVPTKVALVPVVGVFISSRRSILCARTGAGHQAARPIGVSV